MRNAWTWAAVNVSAILGRQFSKSITMHKILLATFVLLAHAGYGQTKLYDEVLNHYHSQKSFNGTVLVATDGKIDYLNAAGLLNREEKTLINTKTKFRIASVTKAFTAVLILQLHEQGKIDLKTPFGKYFPTYKGNAKKTVTIEQLLTYSSAIPDDGGKLEMKTFEIPLKIEDYIDRYCSSDITGKPGEQSIYSNTEYIILTKIIENITQKSFGTVLQENILNRLKMKNTGMLNSKNKVKDLADSYSIDDSTKAITLDKAYCIENFYGAGAMYSTIEDLLKFDIGIFKNKLLNKSTTELMIRPNEKLGNVAYGVWYAGGYGTFNKPFIYRTGGILGACSNWIHTLDNKKSIMLFNNTNGTNLYEMSEQLYLVSTGQKARIVNDKD